MKERTQTETFFQGDALAGSAEDDPVEPDQQQQQQAEHRRQWSSTTGETIKQEIKVHVAVQTH